MNWFGWVLITLFFLNGFANISEVGKGSYMRRQNPSISAIAAVIDVFLIFGVLITTH